MAGALTESLHWAVALIPVLVMLGVFIWLDAFALMSRKEVAALVLLGAIGALAAYPISGRMLDTLPIGFSLYSRFIAPWIEEALKAALMIILFRLNRIGYKLDAVISGFAIGAGFSVVENILYLTFFPEYGTGTWLVRGFGTAIMHGTTLAVMAAIAHEFAERETRAAAGDFDFSLLWFVPGYGVAVALHTAFNQFPDRPLVAMMGAVVIAPVALIGILSLGTSEAQRWLASECEEHRGQVESLRAGHWPKGLAGERVGALASRFDAETVKRIRRYWELQAWLVAEAEEVMMEEAAGDAAFDADAIASALAEIDGLRRALGPSKMAAIQAVLPFSRNDLWEVNELRQRLGRP